MKRNIIVGIRSGVGITLAILIVLLAYNVVMLYPIVGAIGIFILILTVYLYLVLANKIGKLIKEENDKNIKQS